MVCTLVFQNQLHCSLNAVPFQSDTTFDDQVETDFASEADLSLSSVDDWDREIHQDHETKTEELRQHWFTYSEHLDQPLSPEKVEFYALHPEKFAIRFPKLAHIKPVSVRTGKARGCVILVELYNHIIQNSHRAVRGSVNHYQSVIALTENALKVQIRAIAGKMKNFDMSGLDKMYDALRHNPDLMRRFARKAHSIAIRKGICRKSEERLWEFDIPEAPGIALHGDLAVLNFFPGGPIIVPYTFLQCVLDKIESEYSAWLYIYAMDASTDLEGIDLVALHTNLWGILERCYAIHANQAIKVFKTLQPLVLGLTLNYAKDSSSDTEFLSVLLSEFEVDNPELMFVLVEIKELFEKHLERYGEAGIPSMCEAYGHEKLHYLPIVNTEGGLAKMYAYATAIYPTDKIALMENIATTVINYVVGFYKSNHKLPLVNPLSLTHDKLEDMWKFHKVLSIKECHKIPKECWANIIFLKNHDFNYHPDPQDLMDDKAICVHRPFIASIYVKDALIQAGLATIKSEGSRRLFVEIINTPHLDIEQFYKEIESDSEVSRAWHVIMLKAKDGELKLDPRMYSILTMPHRMMMSCNEHNVKNEILRYFPCQYMTDNGVKVRKRISKVTSLHDADGGCWAHCVLDLVQWNYCFRRSQLTKTIAFLNQIFGVNHFDVPMLLFQKSLIVCGDPFLPPGIDGKFTSWQNHCGGNQGIMQAVWTLFTQSTIQAAMYKLDMPFELFGSGDNQVVSFLVKEGSEVGDVAQVVKSGLAQAFTATGLEMRYEESFFSRDVLVFQRNIYYKGIPMPNGLKQTRKSAAGGVELMAGINAVISTSMNGGAAIASHISNQYAGSLFAYMEALTQLMVDPEVSDLIPRDPRAFAVLTMLNTGLGYLPWMQFSSFQTAGSQDHVTNCLALLAKVWEMDYTYRKYIAGALSFTRGNNTKEAKSQLVLDPQSININRPPSAESGIRHMVEKHLSTPGVVKNDVLSSRFASITKEQVWDQCAQLLELRPIDTVLMSRSFDSSPRGRAYNAISSISRISSAAKLTDSNNRLKQEKSISAKVRDADIAAMKHISRNLRTRTPGFESFFQEVSNSCGANYAEFCLTNRLHEECSLSLSYYLRSWSHYLLPELIKGTYGPSPLEQLIFEDIPLDPSGDNHLIVYPAQNVPISIGERGRTAGPFRQVVGHPTEDPLQALRLPVIASSEALRALSARFKLLAWLITLRSDGRVLDIYRESILRAAPELEGLLEYLIPYTKGGTWSHRVRSQQESQTVWSSTIDATDRWFRMSSNSCVILQRNADDRLIHFQDLHFHIFAVLRLCSSYTYAFNVRVEMDHCSYLCEDHEFTLANEPIWVEDPVDSKLVLSMKERAALVKKAEDAKFTRELFTPADLTGQDAIAGAIVLNVMKGVSEYNLGQKDFNELFDNPSVNSGNLNVSLLRMVPLEKMLASLGLHMVLSAQLGPARGRWQGVQLLKAYARFGSSALSVKPYTNLIKALVTAGRSMELSILSSEDYSWDGSKTTVSLFKVLLGAIYTCYQRWVKGQINSSFFIEITSPTWHNAALISRFTSLMPSFQKLVLANPTLKGYHLLAAFNRVQSRLKIIFVPSNDFLVSWGRSNTTTEERDKIFKGPPSRDSGRFRLSDEVIPRTLISASIWETEVVRSPEFDNVCHQAFKEFRETGENFSHKMIKHTAMTSSAPSKPKETFTHLGLWNKPVTTVMCVAEGHGGYLHLFGHAYKRAKLIYNSKVTAESVPNEMITKYVPPEIVCDCNLLNRCANVPFNSATSGDLANPQSWKELKSLLVEKEDTYILFSYDGEVKGGVGREVHAQVEKNVREILPAIFLLKFFSEKAKEALDIFQDFVTENYKSIFLIKPQHSNPYSEELFLVAYDKFPMPRRSLGPLLSQYLAHRSLFIAQLTVSERAEVVYDLAQYQWSMGVCRNFHGKTLTVGVYNAASIHGKIYENVSLLLQLSLMLGGRKKGLTRSEQLLINSSTSISRAWTHKHLLSAFAIYTAILTTNNLVTRVTEEAQKRYWIENFGALKEMITEVEKLKITAGSFNDMLKTLGGMISLSTSFETTAQKVTLAIYLDLLEWEAAHFNMDQYKRIMKFDPKHVVQRRVESVWLRMGYPLLHYPAFKKINSLILHEMAVRDVWAARVVTSPLDLLDT